MEPNTHSNVRVWLLRSRTDSDYADIAALVAQGFPNNWVNKPEPRFYN